MSYTYNTDMADVRLLLSSIPAGSWYSTQSQNSTDDLVEYIMTVNNTDFERDIAVVDGSKFTVEYAGLYNLQFSAQIFNSDGGGNSAAIEIWLKKNGTTIPATGGKVSVTANHPHAIVAWNYFVPLAVGDYLQLAWTTNVIGINIIQNTSLGPGASVPSLIVTMSQVA